jgi:hypothetical protein
MARRTAALKPQLNQIRNWAREGRTDAWIAYQLGSTSATVQEFRHEYGLDKGAGAPVEEPVTPELVVQTISFDSPPPLPPLEDPAPQAAADDAEATGRARRPRRSRTAKAAEATPIADADAPVPAEAEAAETDADAGEPTAEGERARRPRRRRGGRGSGATAAAAETPAAEEASEESEAEAKPARRSRSRQAPSYTGSVVAGAVLVLDPAVARSAAWRSHWADAPAFDVLVEEDQIVLRRKSG